MCINLTGRTNNFQSVCVRNLFCQRYKWSFVYLLAAPFYFCCWTFFTSEREQVSVVHSHI